MNPTAKDVDTYIENAPQEARSKLKELRAAVRKAAPNAVEGISYAMPYYSFRGESGFQSRLCYFGLIKGKKPKIAFYSRPEFLEEYKDEAEKYMTAKSALQFPLDEPMPVKLIMQLVKNGVKKHGKAAKDSSRLVSGKKRARK